MKTKNIKEFFEIKKCRSGSLESYSAGDTPFVSSTTLNNGVEKFVESVNNNEIIKEVPCIAMSGFGFCTIQTEPFIGAGNNGAYVKALVPKTPMSLVELTWYASQINLQSWRFSYGRLAIKERSNKLNLIEFCLKENETANFKKTITKNITNTAKIV